MPMRKLTLQTRTQIVRTLCEGCSIRATSRLTGASQDAILKLLADLGEVLAAFHDATVRDLSVKRIQCDELWAYVGAKDATIKKRPDLQERDDIGSAWVWVGIDPETKLVIGYLVGRKGPESAHAFMDDLAGRVNHDLQISTDGDKNYMVAVPGAFGQDANFGRIIKQYGNPMPDGRIGSSQLQCISVKRQAVSGNPDEKHICTSHIERQNLTVRMSQRRYTRLTNGFSKKWINLCHATTMHYHFYNFCRRHASLNGCTPAMKAGLADHAWSIEEMVELLEAKERAMVGTPALKRGPYRPRKR